MRGNGLEMLLISSLSSFRLCISIVSSKRAFSFAWLMTLPPTFGMAVDFGSS